jgi:spermidine synthase
VTLLKTRAPLAPLFLVSAAAIGFEIALTRFFAIASWSEYGYWVISITMVGFAVSGVVLSLFNPFFLRHAERLMFAIPPLLMVSAALGFYATTIIPFNPLEFQNPDQWFEQLLNIWKYYVALFPFFFFAGLYIGLYFLSYQEEIPKIYGADLAGAGAGALVALTLMFVVHPFYLLAALLPLLVVAGLFHRPAGLRARPLLVLIALALLLALCELGLVRFNRADFNEYKAIYPPLHVQDNRVVEEIKSPRGYFLVLDNFTERLDTDFSNNIGLLKVAGPPLTYGLYNDGNRLTSLPKRLDYDGSYVQAALDSLPYELRPAARTLLIGTRGGFRMREALALGAAHVVALEPEETLHALIAGGVGGMREAALDDARVELRAQSPAETLARRDRSYDVIDIASDFLSQTDANKFAFTVEAVRSYYRALGPNGVVSLPVSIREFTVYAVKMVETARQALLAEGVSAPLAHLMVYRSSWNARILVGREPFSARDIATLRTFADRRSFDTSYFPGIDPAQVQIWNDLPLVSLADGTMLASARASDALMDDTLRLFAGPDAFLAEHFFNLTPSTHDRPFFYSILRPDALDKVLDKIALIPREELGYLINLAVLLQALLFASVILSLPLVRWRAKRPRTEAIVKSILYFAGLGIGFLFLEILLIEKVSFYLNDRTSAFAVVLAAMLVFSGLGSYAASNYLAHPKRGVQLACAGVFVWVIAAMLGLDALLAATLGWAGAAKGLLLLVLIAPLAFALGFPFPLGLYLFRGERAHFLPWAWSLNGAFSVISTPLANLLAISAGYTMLFVASLAFYAIVLLTYPVGRSANRI